MISHDLRNVAHALMLGSEVGLTVDMLRGIAGRLTGLADQVKALEAAEVPPGARTDQVALPPGVVRLYPKDSPCVSGAAADPWTPCDGGAA